MSASKKHRLAEDDVATDVTAKKAKIENGDAVSEEERKRLKKERKEQRKKDKKAKKEAAAESTEPEVTSEKKVKKDKKEKKEKKEKKDKKKSRDTTEESSPQELAAPEANGHTEQPKNGAVEDDAAQTNGSSGYSQTASLSAVPQSEIESFLKTQQIAVSEATSTTTHRPILEFAQLPSTSLLAKSPFASFKTPTPIQSASWPFSLAGRDVVGIAETGSGKTLAFALPCIEALQALPKPKKSKKGGSVANALAVIVSPTRELAMQTHATISPLAELVGMSAVCVYGGASKDDQRTLLHRKGGAEIIVATPGRLKDFLSDGTIALGSVRFAVLDEADRMLDKGFEEDIKMILAECPAKTERQTLMFTATWPISVRGLAEGFMTNPVKITIGGKTRAGDADGEDGNGVVELQANSRISQTVEVVDPRNKEWRLLEILKANQQGKAKNDRILVFCLYKKEAMRVETFLQKKGVRVASIHGDLKQEQRTRSLEAFKAGTTTVLVATDVAARGLDIPEVKLVVNVTFPLTIEDYVHRIGRTGRAGKTGQAITLFTEHDKAHSGSLVNILKGANQPVPDDLLKFGTTVKKKGHDAYGAFFKDVDMSKKATKITFD